MTTLPRPARARRLWWFIALAVLGLAALLAARLWLQGWFEPSTPIRLYAASGSDLKPGMPVKFRAFKIGAVQSITLKDDAHVDVVARIENRYLKFIRQTSLARLSKEGLIGNSFISIETSDTSAPALGKNAYLALMPGTDMEVIAQQVKDQVDPVIAELHTLLAGLNHPQGPFQQSLRHLAVSTGKLNDTHTQLNSLLRHTDTLIDRDARQTLTAINRDLPAVMRQLNATTQATQAASQSLNDAMQASATQLPGLIRDGRLLIQQSNDTLDGLRQHWPLKQLSAPIAPDTGDIHGAQD